MLNYDEFLELVKKRRSIRAFNNEPVSDEDIKKIIDASRYAPSGMNFQPWEYIVVRDKETINKLVTVEPESLQIPAILKRKMQKETGGKKMPKKMKLANNPQALIVAVGDTRKMITLPGQNYKFKNGKIKLGRKFPMVDVKGLFYSSMANSFMLMITAAATLSLGCQYVTLVSSPLRKKYVKSLLQLPDYMEVYDAAAVGYPKYTPRQKYQRPLDDIIHHEHYEIEKSLSDETIVERAKTREDMKYDLDEEKKRMNMQ